MHVFHCLSSDDDVLTTGPSAENGHGISWVPIGYQTENPLNERRKRYHSPTGDSFGAYGHAKVQKKGKNLETRYYYECTHILKHIVETVH